MCPKIAEENAIFLAAASGAGSGRHRDGHKAELPPRAAANLRPHFGQFYPRGGGERLLQMVSERVTGGNRPADFLTSLGGVGG